MDAATLAARIDAGYGKAAKVLGRTVTIYRPSGSGAPIVAGNIIGTQFAAFDTVPQFTFVNPQKFGVVNYYALINGSSLAVGDYLVGSAGTYFVATLDDISPPLVIRCNHNLTIKRPGDPATGSSYYGGDQVTAETAIITSWPAAITQGTKGERNPVGLPGDVRQPWSQILLPASVPVQLRYADVALDDQAQPVRYILSGVEQTALGWRIQATMAVA